MNYVLRGGHTLLSKASIEGFMAFPEAAHVFGWEDGNFVNMLSENGDSSKMHFCLGSQEDKQDNRKFEHYMGAGRMVSGLSGSDTYSDNQCL